MFASEILSRASPTLLPQSKVQTTICLLPDHCNYLLISLPKFMPASLKFDLHTIATHYSVGFFSPLLGRLNSLTRLHAVIPVYLYSLIYIHFPVALPQPCWPSNSKNIPPSLSLWSLCTRYSLCLKSVFFSCLFTSLTTLQM